MGLNYLLLHTEIQIIGIGFVLRTKHNENY